MKKKEFNKEVEIVLEDARLSGELIIPNDANGVVIFSHGSGSSRSTPRNKFVAQRIRENGFGTFLLDLLTKDEDAAESNRFDIELTTNRLVAITNWFIKNMTGSFPIGYFGASSGAATALLAAARLDKIIMAVVCRGGRPDLAIHELPVVKAPTLFIVGSLDYYVMDLNEKAYEMLSSPKEMRVIEGASHLFDEPGTLEQVAEESANWFKKHLKVNEHNLIAL